MFNQINQILRQHGYQHIELNTSGIYFHLCRQQDNAYAVVTIDETTGTVLTKEQFLHVSEQIRSFLISLDCRTTSFLYLLVTSDPSSSHRLFSGQDCYWIINPAARQFLVYENKTAFFEPLRSSLELLFPAPSSQSNQSFFSPQQTSSYQPPDKNNYFTCNTLLVIINVLIFLLTDTLGIVLNSYHLLDLGAVSWQDVFQNHQYYRIFTSMFLHDGIDHIFNNMLVMFVIGQYLEKQVGHLSYLIIYFSSGIIAGCTSMVYNMIQNTNVASVGASGAIFGLMGALLITILMRKGREQSFSARQILFMVAFSLYGGFASQGVDNAAHIGGFLGGAFITAIYCLKERQDTKTC